MEKPRGTLRRQTETIIVTWPVKYGNWHVNSVLQARGKSYLTLPCGTSGEPTTYPHEAPQAPTQIITRTSPIVRAQAPAGRRSTHSSEQGDRRQHRVFTQP